MKQKINADQPCQETRAIADVAHKHFYDIAIFLSAPADSASLPKTRFHRLLISAVGLIKPKEWNYRLLRETTVSNIPVFRIIKHIK